MTLTHSQSFSFGFSVTRPEPGARVYWLRVVPVLVRVHTVRVLGGGTLHGMGRRWGWWGVGVRITSGQHADNSRV